MSAQSALETALRHLGASENTAVAVAARVAAEFRAEVFLKGKGTGTTGNEPTPDFFQPGRTYTDNNGYRAPELTTHFHVEHVTRHPEGGQLRAIGWSRSLAPGSRWHGDFRDGDEFAGWTELSAPLLPGVAL
ncbi:hypothetical protein ACFV1H_17985 [Streptomyces virginiae]|uniref:hypothetical protein n=1 Tax=Streptomyces virginiae TaxID=1961 RepID=UPI0036BF988A